MKLHYSERDGDGEMKTQAITNVDDLTEAERMVFEQHRAEPTESDAVWRAHHTSDPKCLNPLAIWAKVRGKESLPESVPLPSQEAYAHFLSKAKRSN